MLVALVDTGHANIRSVQKALEAANDDAGLAAVVETTRDPARVREAHRVVVPGQGGFGDCVKAVRGGLDEAIIEGIRGGKPYFGICLGLQILFESSDEAPGVEGFGVFSGSVRRLAQPPGLKIPHMGWNELELSGARHPLLEAPLQELGAGGGWFYFVHSFHAEPTDASIIQATVGYGPNSVTAAIGRENVFASQFHPEKSQKAGISLLRAFLKG